MDHCRHLKLVNRHRLIDHDPEEQVTVKVRATMTTKELAILRSYAYYNMSVRQITSDTNQNRRTVIELLRRNLRRLLPPPDTFINRRTTSRGKP